MNSNAKILIADDAAMFRELGALFLARTARVLTANNGFEALEVARRVQPNVIVADFGMPCMGGEELCRRIKTDPHLCQTPVIIVTAGEDADDRARAVRAGADDVIEKPISRIGLIQAVNRFLLNQKARGLARVSLEAQVHIVHRHEERWGVARNLSRGGMFVEAEFPMPLDTEVALEFRLPETRCELAPTAQVIWRRESDNGAPAGMGLQFLALDRDAVAEIDSFIYEHAAVVGPAPIAAAGGNR